MKDHLLESQTLDWLIRSSQEAIVIADARGVVLMGSEAAARLFHIPAGQLVGSNVADFLPELEAGRTGEGQPRHASAPADDTSPRTVSPTMELDGRRTDGSVFPAEVCVSPLVTHWGLPLSMVTIRDVRARRQAEQAVRDSEARLRAVFDTAVDAIITIDERGAIERVNPAAVRIFGYEEKELLGRNISVLMPSPYREMHDRYIGHYLHTGEKKIIGIGREVLGMRKDGTVFPMDLAVAEMRVGERRMFTGMVRDITERKRAEAMFRTLVEQTRAITYVLDPDDAGRFRYVSPQVRSLGFSPEDWLADSSLRLNAIHPADRPRVEAAIKRNLGEGTPLRLEYRMSGKDGRERWFRDEAEVVRDASGQALFVQGILIDITQNKLAEETLRESREALRRLAAHQESIKESERKRIAQEIHDELGALLTGIKAHVSVSAERAAQAGGTPDPLLVEAARLSEEAIQAVRRVFNDLRPSVLDQLGVWEAIAWHASQVESRFGLACDCIIAPSALATEVDADRSIMLFRIVQEALTNVIRHADASLVTVQAAVKDGVVNLEIHDDGKGFAAESPADRHSWGIQGMQERTRHFGGQLTVSSTAGHGTRVVLRLPLEDNDGR